MKRNDGKGGIVTLLCISLFFLGLAIVMFVSSAKQTAGRIETMATITEVEKVQNEKGEDEYTFYIKYTIDGTEYTSSIGQYIPYVSKGSQISILYKENDFTDVAYNTTDYTTPVILTVCSVGTLIFILYALIKNPKRKSLAKLKAQVRPIEATIKDFSIISKAKGKYNISITCGDYQGKTYSGKYTVEKPEIFYIGGRINVYVERENSSSYVIDVQDYADKRK